MASWTSSMMTGIIVVVGKRLSGEDEDLVKELRFCMIAGGHRYQHRAPTSHCDAELRQSPWDFPFVFSGRSCVGRDPQTFCGMIRKSSLAYLSPDLSAPLTASRKASPTFRNVRSSCLRLLWFRLAFKGAPPKVSPF